MSEPVVRRARRRWKYLLLLLAAALVAVIVGLWYTTTSSFQSYARRRLVAELERITGGRAEVGSFHIVPFHTQVEVRDVTIHGKEAAGEAPLIHVDHLVARLKVISFLRAEFGFHDVSLEHPVVHIAISADGTTNVPAPKLPDKSANNSANNPIAQLFSLSINHLSMHNGELIWANQQIPLDFSVESAGLQMDYSYLRGRYESRLTLGKVDTTFDGWRPLSWMTTIDFALGPTFVDIKSLQWNSGRSRFEAAGRISDFRNPQADGNYDLHADLAEVASITRRRDLREGMAELKGHGRISTDTFATTGALAVRDLEWLDDQIALKKTSLTADYSVTDQQIRVSKLMAKLLGGNVAGDAQVDNWLYSSPLPPANAKKMREDIPVITAGRPSGRSGERLKQAGVQKGAIHLRLRDLAARELASALDTPAHPLGRFHPAAAVSGTVDASWRGSPKDAEVSFALDAKPLLMATADELLVKAQIQGKYQAGPDTLELALLKISTPSTRIDASGTLSASSTLHVAVSTSNLEDWRPLISALGGPPKIPFHVNGNAAFTGVVGGALTSPTVAGTLVAQDFEFNPQATTQTSVQPVHWDSFAASVQFSPQSVAFRGGSLRRGNTSADFDLSASLQKGRLTLDSPFTAHVNLHNVDVASTAVLAGFHYPVSGTADASLQIAGTRAKPQVQGHIHATNASAYQEPIETFDADVHMEKGDVSLNNIHLTHQDAVIVGSAAYTPSARTFQLDLSGTNFDLARIGQIHLDELPVEGRADFKLQGSGTLDAPIINASVHIRDLTLDRELAGGLYLDAVTRQGKLVISGHSDLPQGTLALEGTVGMRGDYPASITARFDHVDLDAFWRASLGHQLTGHSDVGGMVALNGPLRYPRQWIFKGELNDVTVEVEHAKMHNQGPVRFTYAQQTAQIEPLHMVGDGTDITGHGSMQFGGQRDLDLAADGVINLKLLGKFDPDLTASGNATVHMTVGGSVDHALPRGTIEIKGGAANYAGMPSGLSEVNGAFNFTRNRIYILNLTARTGGGTLDLKGEATSLNHQLNFTLTAVGKDVRLRYPPGVSSTADAELHWVGTRSSSIVSGDVLVTKLAVTPGFDFGSYLERNRTSAAITPANSPFYNVKLDVAVRTAPELQMKTAVARLSGDADLRVRGSVARPSVLGRADILEGDATFNGIKFRLERGDITFANPVAIEPQVNLQATTHVRNYDLDITVTGTSDRLAINYRSEPPLPKSDIIALLALGRTSEESQQLQQQSGQTVFNDEATALIINQAINSTVSSRLEKVFGVSRVKIDPQGLTTETNPTARGPQITVEQQFANNVSLTYSTNVSQSSQQIIQGEYFFTRDISAVGTRDQNGVVSFDVRIRRRKK